MAEVSAGDVKALRDSTGAGMMDCKRALADAAGDVERARELLRERGLAKAGKRAGRETSEGAVVFASKGGKGALIELGCETDFVAKTPDFQGLAQSIVEACLQASGITDADQALALKLGGGTVDDVIKAAVAKVGENIQLKRVASVEVQGVTGGYVHGGGKLGVLVAIETGLSGGDAEAVARDVAMHVAAHDPTPIAVDRADVPASVVEKERKILTAQAMESGKPANVVEKMVDGRINKFFSENCLLAQGFVKDPDTSIRDLLAKAGKASGSTLTVKSFVRFKLGEAAS
ncbi:MAG: elongation factor Ts [Deltaproteobacteria bacterium]|nr:elongation factor Ts [Deltaproteobacteria bacterium]